MECKQASEHLSQLALLLELRDENQFRVRAVSAAARILDAQPDSIQAFLATLETHPVKGIGPQILGYLKQLQDNGVLDEVEMLRAYFPETLFELFAVPGLGVKKVKALYEQLQITSLEELIDSCNRGIVAKQKGFGEKTVENILSGAQRYLEFKQRFRLDTALREAAELLDYLQRQSSVQQVEVTGSVRRGMETVRNLDLVVSTTDALQLEHALSQYERVKHLSRTDWLITGILRTGLPLQVHLAEQSRFGARLLLTTGSASHLNQLRDRAQKLQLSFPSPDTHSAERPGGTAELPGGTVKLPGGTEEEVFAALQLRYIEPELREGRNEVESATIGKGEAPARLIELSDLKGIVHAHSTYSDGKHSLAALAQAIRERGMQYLGISDHSQTAAYARGLRETDILRQHEEIDELNEKLAPFKIFKGIESDILGDGSLDYPERILERFDFVIASLHSGLSMAREAMIKRMDVAIANPFTTFIGHPTTRKLLERDEAAVEIPHLLESAAAHGVAVEINCSPKRLDLDWRYHQAARKLGILLPICPDAHSITGLNDIRYGVIAARKGGLGVADVPTAWNTEEISEFFAARRCANRLG